MIAQFEYFLVEYPVRATSFLVNCNKEFLRLSPD